MKYQGKNKKNKSIAVAQISAFLFILTFLGYAVCARAFFDDKDMCAIQTLRADQTQDVDKTQSQWISCNEMNRDALSWIYEESGVSGRRLGRAGNLTYVLYSKADSNGETTKSIIVAQRNNVGSEFEVSQFPFFMEGSKENIELAKAEIKSQAR